MSFIRKLHYVFSYSENIIKREINLYEKYALTLICLEKKQMIFQPFWSYVIFARIRQGGFYSCWNEHVTECSK